jgi:integrase
MLMTATPPLEHLESLAADKYTRIWLAQYERPTRERYLRDLARFREWLRKEPKILLLHARRRGPENVNRALTDYYNYLVEDEGKAPTSANQYVTRLRSYFTANGQYLGRFRRKTDVQATYERTKASYLSPEDVSNMIKSRKNARDKFVIAFLAQTGQRIGILTAMKRKMMKEKIIHGHGIVRVPSTFPNRRGQNVNTLRREYTFIVGRDTMELLPLLDLDKRSWDKEGRLRVSPRQMGRIVDKAAQVIGIQDKARTKIGQSWSDVHPNTFRKYWKKCMLDAKADTRAVLHMMGANLPSILRGWEPTDKELLEAYEKAESKLSLVDALRAEEA